MGSIGQAITPSIPPVGSPGPQFATDINAILSEMVTRLSAKVPLSSLDLSSSLNLSGSPLLNAGYVTLANEAVAPVSSPVNRVAAFSGDLYYIGPSGAVQVTTGATLNAAAVGGITGAYGGANPAQFRYDNVNTRYDAYANFSTGTWAYTRALGFDIAANATSLVFARLQWAGSANKTYTLPATTASANDRPMYMNTTGQISLGHGSKSFSYSSHGAFTGGGASITSADGGLQNSTTAAVQAQIPVQRLMSDFGIVSITFNFSKTTVAATQFTLKKSVPGGAATTLATLSSTTIGSNQLITVALGATEVITNGYYYVDYQSSSGTANSDTWYGFYINGTLAG
jgi:hypothetical protein